MKGVMGRVVAGSVRETGDVAGGGRVCAGNGGGGRCGEFWRVYRQRRRVRRVVGGFGRVVAGYVREAGDVAGGRGLRA